MLGREHAIAMLNAGASVILLDIDNNKLEDAKKFLCASVKSANILTYTVDITNKVELLAVDKDLERQNIAPHILINNAAVDAKVKSSGLATESRFENMELETWNMELAVGLTGAFLTSQIFGSRMAIGARGGVIINIASDLSVIAPNQNLYKKDSVSPNEQPVKPVTYSVIKTGIIGLTKYLATYWCESGVRCNALSPGGVKTDSIDEVFLAKVESLIPLGRMATRSEYAGALVFLASDASSYLNGHNLVVDGGRSIW